MSYYYSDESMDGIDHIGSVRSILLQGCVVIFYVSNPYEDVTSLSSFVLCYAILATTSSIVQLLLVV